MLASAASARSSPAASSGSPLHDEETLDQRPGLARQPRRRLERRLFEKALGDLGDGAAADRLDAGDREQIRDQVMRRLRIGAGKRGEHALIFRRAVGGGERELIEIVRQRAFAIEILDQPALPRRREIERGDEGGEQPDVAHADFRRVHAILRGRLKPERQHFGVGRRLVLAAEDFRCRLAGIPLPLPRGGETPGRDSRSPRPCRPRAIADTRAIPGW